MVDTDGELFDGDVRRLVPGFLQLQQFFTCLNTEAVSAAVDQADLETVWTTFCRLTTLHVRGAQQPTRNHLMVTGISYDE